MYAYPINRRNSQSLKTQIKNAEQQIYKRRRSVSIRSSTLIRHIQLSITRPGALLLMSGIGFIIAELSKNPSPKPAGSSQARPHTTPLMKAMNLVGLMRSLFSALSLVWLLKSYYPLAPKKPGSNGTYLENKLLPVTKFQ